MTVIEDSFRWIIGVLIAALSGVLGWLTNVVFGSREVVSGLRTQIAVLQARSYVDPIEYTKAITSMASALSALSAQLQEITIAHKELKAQLTNIVHDLDAIAQSLAPSGRSR